MRVAPGTLLAMLGFLVSCAQREAERPLLVVKEQPVDEVLRVGSVWQSVTEDRGFRVEPDPIALFDSRVGSTLRLSRSQTAEEQISVEDLFTLRAGTKFRCASEGSQQVSVRYGRKGEDAAVEMQRAALKMVRRCTPAGFPQLEFVLPEISARFVLRGDELHSFAPATERRVYIPLE